MRNFRVADIVENKTRHYMKMRISTRSMRLMQAEFTAKIKARLLHEAT
jgi:hypothetical protein